MAYLDYDPSLDFDAQETQMLQAAARIKALREKNLMPSASTDEIGGFSSALTPGFKYSGKVQKTPLLSALAPILQDYTTGQMDKELATNRGALTAAQNEALSQWIAGAPKGTDAIPADPGVTPLTPNDDEGNAMPSSPALPAVPAKAPTRQEVMAHAALGSKIPMARKMAQEYLSDQLIKEPEREEARAARLHERKLILQQALQKQKDDAELKKLIVGQQTDTQLRVAEINAQARRDAAADRRADAGNKTEGTWVVSPNLDADGEPFMYNNKHPDQTRKVGGKPAPAPKDPKPLTAKQEEKLDIALTNHNVFSNAFHNIREGHTGRYAQASVYGGKNFGVLGSDTAQFWSPVEEQKAQKNKLMSGANFTKPEMDRAANYQPGVVKTLEQNKQEMGQLAIDSGLAHLRGNLIQQNPGAYVDNDGAVVLKDGTVIKETKSRSISKEEMQAQRLDPLPTLRDIEARLDGGSSRKPSGGASAPAAPKASLYPPGVDPSKLSVVRSKEERDGLPPNTPYLDAQGNLAYTPKK